MKKVLFITLYDEICYGVRLLSAVVKECGLEKMLLRPIGELSKGYKQRVGLAQALLHDPQILILDEPTSGLDPNQIIEIRDLIRRLDVEQATMANTLARMERDGLIVRKPHADDRRAQSVWLTNKARALEAPAKTAAASVNDKALATLSQEEKDTFVG